ncbi:MAG TPA: hypothetical protein VND93_08735 [Myxococcales bacterium]|nr:hypothetical protein [Myxococcales bacterium]
MLAILVLAGCHPRYGAVRDEVVSNGSGGSGGLDSIRAKILISIGARDYQHARDLLELAADATEEERARLGQMISAAERGLVPFLQDKLPHIFRLAEGHFPQDTAEARELLQTTAMEANFVGVRRNGLRVYQQILDTGRQIWVYVLEGTIREGGYNEVPRSTGELLSR